MELSSWGAVRIGQNADTLALYELLTLSLP